eukprot:1163154-Pyramimonas_sp.AAC.1
MKSYYLFVIVRRRDRRGIGRGYRDALATVGPDGVFSRRGVESEGQAVLLEGLPRVDGVHAEGEGDNTTEHTKLPFVAQQLGRRLHQLVPLAQVAGVKHEAVARGHVHDAHL